MLGDAVLYWDQAAQPPELPGIYDIMEPWPYSGGNITGFNKSPGFVANLLINGEAWTGQKPKCGDLIQVEIEKAPNHPPPYHVDIEFSHDQERCK